MTRLRSRSRSSLAARAKVRRGWGEIKMGLELALTAKSPAITAAADEPRAVSRYWTSSTKTRLPVVADCRLETVVTVTELSPRRRQPSCSARSRRVRFMVLYCRFPGRVCTTREAIREDTPSQHAAVAELRSAGQPRAAVPMQPLTGEGARLSTTTLA